MASKSLGTLTLDLIAKVGGFVAGMDAAERSSEKWRKTVENNAKAAGAAIGAGAAAAVTAMTAFAVSAVTSTASAAKEITNLSTLAGLSTTQFQKYAAAAATVGIEQDKLSDIFKDTNDKLGDFLATGGGELKNFFETIAPKVGVTAEQFRNLNSADALQLYVSSLQKANVNQAQMTFFMEAIADEATALVPLLSNGGKGFRELGDAAEATGMILDTQTIAAAQQFNTELTVLSQYANAAKVQLAAEFMPVLAQMTKDLASGAKEAGGLRGAMSDLGDGLVSVTVFVANTIDVVRGAFNLTAAALVGTFATAMGYLQKIGAGANQILNFMSWGETAQGFRDTAASFAADAEMSFGVARMAAEDMHREFNKPLAGEAIRKYVEDAKKAAAELPEVVVPGGGGAGFTGKTDAQKAAEKEAEAAQKKINQAYESTEESLARQIALINTSTDARKDATEVAKLLFDIESGKLVGINAQQQERLKGLAAELDRLGQLKKANEDALAVSQFEGSVKQQLEIDQRGLNVDFVNAYNTDETKARALEMLSIEQDYQDQMQDLLNQRNAKEISQSRYEQENEILEAALKERLAKQEKYYKDVDKLQQNGTAGFVSGFATQAEASMDLYGSMQSVGADTFHNLTTAMTEWARTGELDVQAFAGTFLQSIGSALMSYAAAQVAMAGLSAFTAMIGVPFIGPAIAPGAAIAAAAAAGALAIGVGASLDGQAHDGIDFVPADGTWNLKRGERVTTAETSAKLDRTLDSVSKNSTPQGALKIINNGPPVTARREFSDGELKLILDAAEDRIANGFTRGTGKVSRAAGAAYGMRRDPK